MGARVVIFDLLDEGEGQKRTQELGAAAYRKVDQGDEEQVQNAIAETTEEFGGLNIVIGNAGVGPRGSLLDLKKHDWEEVLRVNLIGCALLAKASIARMLTQRPDAEGIRGKILFTSSWVGTSAVSPAAVDYCVSKAGLNHLVRLIAQEFAPAGIRVNAVAPSIVDAGLTQKGILKREPSVRDKYTSHIPVGAMGTATQVADAFVFLCSRESNYMTGQLIPVDGGCSIGRRGW